MKSAIRTMGYARSSPALTAAAEKGLKYGRRTWEIAQDEERNLCRGGLSFPGILLRKITSNGQKYDIILAK